MGRRFPGGVKGGGGGGGASGKYNQCEMWSASGTFTWTTPSDFDDVAVRVYVWGAGGCDGCSGGSGNAWRRRRWTCD